MVTNASAPSVEVLGLVVVKTAIEADPLAEFYGHGPFMQVEEAPIDLVDEHETLGQLIARLGLNEGEAITIRVPTVAEQRAQLATVLAKTADPSVHTWQNERPQALRDTDGQLVDAKPDEDDWR